MRLVQLQSVRSVRQLMFGLAVIWHCLHAACLDGIGRVPHAGNVGARSRGWRLLILLILLILPSGSLVKPNPAILSKTRRGEGQHTRKKEYQNREAPVTHSVPPSPEPNSSPCWPLRPRDS